MDITDPMNLSPESAIWMLVCISLLVFMQLGFSCLEAGLVRSKNSINVVIKNCLDFCVSLLIFSFLGFAIMFAPFADMGNVIANNLLQIDSSQILFILFQAMFCATAVTIISGAVVERMSLKGYLFIAATTALIIYPIVGRWIWGNNTGFTSPEGAWLQNMGFVDFAGATQVHSLGGWIALACVLFIGPRIGRFGDDSQPIRPSSLPLASLGVFMLWVGWIGFNGGSQFGLTEQTTSIIFVTLLGGLTGTAIGAISSKYKKMKPDVIMILNGGLAGLVSVTGSADLLMPWQAILIGAIAGTFPLLFEAFLEKCQVDDGVGVVPVHLGGGVLGTVFVGLIRPLAEGETRIEAIGIQLLGIIVVGVVAFSFIWTALSLASRFMEFRVSKAGEMIGLNVWEHDASTAGIDLIQQMSVQAELGLFNHRIVVEPYTEEHHIATFYNSVLDKFNQLQDDKDEALKKTLWMAEHDALTGVKNRRAITQILSTEFDRMVRNGSSAAMAIVDLDHFKKVNDQHGHDAGDAALIHFVSVVTPLIRKTDILGRIGGEEFLIMFPDTDFSGALKKADFIRESIANTPLEHKSQTIELTASIGLTPFDGTQSPEAALKDADLKLYKAKAEGRNRVIFKL